MTDLFLSVGLCTYNRAHMVIDSLNSLKEQTLSSEKFEIIVVDNNSRDKTQEVVKQFAIDNKNIRVKYVFEEKQGISHARNAAYQNAQGNFIVFIDDDELAKPDWLGCYYRFIAKNPNSAIVAGKINVLYPPNETPDWNSTYIENWHGRYNFGNSSFKITQELIDNKKAYYPNNGNMAVNVEFLKEVGGFDITLGRKKKSLSGGEDTKLGKLALAMNREVLYNPDSLIEHIILPERNTLAFLQQKHFEQGKSFIDLHYSDISIFKALKIFIHKILSIFIRSFKMLLAEPNDMIALSLKNYFDIGIMNRIVRGKQ